MPKVIITLKDSKAAQQLKHVLESLKAFRCGLRSIACSIRNLLQDTTIEHDED